MNITAVPKLAEGGRVVRRAGELVVIPRECPSERSVTWGCDSFDDYEGASA